MEIACQTCIRVFKVTVSAANFGDQTIAEAIRWQELHYEDPPNVGVAFPDLLWTALQSLWCVTWSSGLLREASMVLTIFHTVARLSAPATNSEADDSK